jgi:hypothetical protein
MSKKQLVRSKNDLADAESQAQKESMPDVPDLTPEQWGRLKAQTHRLEKDYVPTRSIVPGL